MNVIERLAKMNLKITAAYLADLRVDIERVTGKKSDEGVNDLNDIEFFKMVNTYVVKELDFRKRKK